MPSMTRNCLVVDLDKCIGCYSCEANCKMENDIPLGEKWNKVVIVGPYGTFPDIHQYWLPTHCQQCANAPCVEVCPTGASYRDEDTNIVLVDKSKCIGCKYCMMACPYGVRSWNSSERVVEKCTLCGHLTVNGELPMCVQKCCGECRYYGDLDDPDSDVSKAIAEAGEENVHHLTDVGNNPVACYIMSDKYATWRSSDE